MLWRCTRAVEDYRKTNTDLEVGYGMVEEETLNAMDEISWSTVVVLYWSDEQQ